MARVAQRVIIFQWDNTLIPRYWLIRDYLPEFATACDGRPTLTERAANIDAEMETVPIPWDCIDGFFHAYWRRPHAYLQDQVRRGTSVWARVGPQAEQRAVQALRTDLAAGVWHERNQQLLDLAEADLGARLLVATNPRR